MTTRRDALVALLGTAAAVWPMKGLVAAAAGGARTVQPATLERPSPAKTPPPFVPYGILAKSADHDYVEEEWFASGVDEAGRPYKTQIFLYKPRNPARFSGTIIVEPLHAQGAPPVFMYTSTYIMRSGHGWACVGSQKSPLDAHVKPKDPAYYGSLNIEAEPAPPGAPAIPPPPPAGQTEDPAITAARQAQAGRTNQASNIILAQAGAALRSGKGPFQGYKVRHIILVGHSQTGGVVTNYILRGHETHRLAGGASVYDGYFPSGAPRGPFPPRDVPLLQVVSDADVFDGNARGPEFSGRKYRRADSDSPNDRYRLYELAGTGHMGTRYPPHNNPKNWASVLGDKTDSVIMNSQPHYEQFSMALNHLVQWVAKGTAPPRAPRLELAADGRYIAKDANGNSRGGIRSAQMDVPRATYFPTPTNPDGTQRGGIVGTEVPFDAAKMKKLYGTPQNYVKGFNRRLDELVSQGWLLPQDAANMRAEAAAQRF